MAKFTPGPWRVVSSGNLKHETATTYYVETDKNKNIEMIADLADVHGYKTENDKANARLISKAPEMYEILKILANEGQVLTGDIRHLLKEIDGR